MSDIFKKTGFLLELTRVWALPMTVMSWFVAFSLALVNGGNFWHGILALFGVSFAHLGANLIDDYFDVRFEFKRGVRLEDIKFQKSKAKYILDKTVSMNQVLTVVCVLFLLAALIGVYFAIKCGLPVIIIAGIAAVLCVVYSLFTRIGLGEFTVGVLFAPLLMTGVYYVMTYKISLPLLILSVSTGLLTILLLDTHALMDWDYDVSRSKKTLCTLVKTKKNALKVIISLIFLAYTNIFVFVLIGIFPFEFLCVYLTLPLANELLKSLKDFTDEKEVEFNPKWWRHGPMENWDNIVKANEQSFMYRVYLARNLMNAFSLILVLLILVKGFSF